MNPIEKDLFVDLSSEIYFYEKLNVLIICHDLYYLKNSTYDY